MVSFRVSFSPKTVGAYRIRPDVGERGMTAASILSLKACRAARQGFPAWENVPAQRGKVFPPGEMFLGNRASFSRPGKCSSETERGFPIDSTLNISFVCPVRSHEMVTVNNQDSILVLENAASEELKMPICGGRLPIFLVNACMFFKNNP